MIKYWRCLIVAFFVLLFISLLVLINSCASKPNPNTSYPPEIPTNFKEAPSKLVCERENPTAIHFNFYANLKERWLIRTLGRNGKDILLILERGGKPLEEFVFLNDVWKNGLDLTIREAGEYLQSNQFSPEENGFRAECESKMLDNFSAKNKPYETPIKVHDIVWA